MAVEEKSINYDKALKYVFWLFEKRDYSEKEIRDKLGRNYACSVIEQVVEKLISTKLLDDEKFAGQWADYRLRQNKSKNFILRELIHKGIKRDFALETLDSFSVNEVQLALNAIKSKINKYSKLEPIKAKNKIFQFLSRKGFGYDVIDEVVKKVIKKEEIIDFLD
ncbi:MAG: hypothetical protein A2474_05570 [Elusimicrobia bacterium RIFOXYC2_FULL_34_12]|nr:MAG: hypothetical protein A2474_05570 [Elusimicrobia bacterium RIFOXYC2_FULL_34_12]HAM39291.1 hypothetical protein [Elusimicrobiota bacterium]